jgi:hypothetical protein
MEPKSCSICYEEEQIETLSCRHDFCESCIGKWKNTKLSCPVCRSIIVPQISLSTRTNYYGKDSVYIGEYWDQIHQTDRLVEFMSQLAFAKHYIDCKDLIFAKKHFLKKHVVDYSNELFNNILFSFLKEKKHYDKILNVLLRTYEPQKRQEIYKNRMSSLHDSISSKQIKIYKSKAVEYYHSKIKNDPKLLELRKSYVESKLENYHSSNRDLVKIELLEDEIFVDEQFFVKTFYKEVDDYMLICENPPNSVEMIMNQVENIPEPQNHITENHTILANDEDSSDDESTVYESDEDSNDDESTVYETEMDSVTNAMTNSNDDDDSDDDDSDDDYDSDDDEESPLEKMIVNFDNYMKKPKTDMETYFKSGQFQKDFMWFMKNVFMYSFFDITSNEPIGKFVNSYTKTISKIFQYLELTDTIYQETLEQYIELYDFLGEDSGNVFFFSDKGIIEYYEMMKNIVEEVV